jgi:hypothetical protein
MSENNEVIAEIKVKYEDALRKIGELKTETDRLKAAEAELGKEMKELRKEEVELAKARKNGLITEEEYNKSLSVKKGIISEVSRDMAAYRAEIKFNADAVRVLEREVQNNIKSEQAQEGSINQLRARVANLSAAYNALGDAVKESEKGKALLRQVAELNAQLKAGEEAYGDHRRSVGHYEKATMSLRGELRNLTEELARMKIAGDENSEEYKAMAARLGELKDAMSDVTRETGNLANDTKNLSGIAETLNVLVSGFGVFQSVLGLSAEKNGELVKTLRNLQVVMTAVTSLTAIQNALQKQSAALTMIGNLQLWARDKALKASTKSTIAATIAQKIYNAVAAANPYVLLALAIASVIAALAIFSSRSKTQAAVQKEQNERALKYNEILQRQNEEILKNADARKRAIEDQIRVLEAQGAAEEQVAALRERALDVEAETIAKLAKKNVIELDMLEENSAKLREYRSVLDDLQSVGKEGYKKNELLRQSVINLAGGYLEYADALEVVEGKLKVLEGDVSRAREVQERERQYLIDREVFNATRLKKEREAGEKRLAEHKKALDKERELVRKAEDAALDLLEEGLEKQRAAVKKGYARQVEDLQRQLATDASTLTPAARQAIANLIRDLRSAEARELARLDSEELQGAVGREARRLQLKLEAARAGSEQEYQLRTRLLVQQEKDEIEANRKLAEHERADEADIRAKYNNLLDTEEQKYRASRLAGQEEAFRVEWENRLLSVREGSAEEARIRLEAAEATAARLRAMTDEEKTLQFGSIEAWKNANLQADREVVNSRQHLDETVREGVQMQLDAASTMSAAFQEVLEGLAEDNEAFAGFAKALALFNIGLDTAKAIAAIPAMSTQGDPYTYALRVATAVASVLTTIAKARQMLSKEKEPKAPSFASGGTVSGPGSGTSDSVPAMLSNGESVMTAVATRMFAPLLSTLNQVGGGVPISTRNVADQAIGEEMMTRAFARALERMPNPVVSVREITRVTNEVKAIEGDARV